MKAAEALNATPWDLEREHPKWFHIGMALHNANAARDKAEDEKRRGSVNQK